MGSGEKKRTNTKRNERNTTGSSTTVFSYDCVSSLSFYLSKVVFLLLMVFSFAYSPFPIFPSLQYPHLFPLLLSFPCPSTFPPHAVFVVR